MPKHEDKYCPRCNTLFECKVGNIALCQCSKVELTHEQRNYLSSQFSDCLCASCMAELKTEFNIKQHEASINKIIGGYRGE
ncbi:cysteine-rich CWC family protein [Fulvivirga maritima]|uniref:cysteine-rich CWC family protein n=1 Tax=Fulvivirga maritima TaxID=2904247 RepID=UPI001F42D8D4|nr:cysteine-rich CWC family protein [Fulvivirga maritima]UII25090.1 cysteine-rich CWC family protein [Fulvivirga maritima]